MRRLRRIHRLRMLALNMRLKLPGALVLKEAVVSCPGGHGPSSTTLAPAIESPAAYGRKTRRLVRICAVAGLVVLGLSLWIASSALAQVVFYGGVLRALCGPMWTGLVSPWLEERR